MTSTLSSLAGCGEISPTRQSTLQATSKRIFGREAANTTLIPPLHHHLRSLVAMAKAPKRASKRVSTKQRVKVDKKIKEAHRKQRRDAKKNPTWKSKKKADPGIPNSFPFKEQLLDEMHMRREREEQRKVDEREKRLAAKRGKKAGEDEESDEEEEDEVNAEVEVGSEEGSPVRSGPLHAPLYAGSLETLLDDDEVKNVVLALDARDPSAWRCPPVEKLAELKGKQVHLAITRAGEYDSKSLIAKHRC